MERKKLIWSRTSLRPGKLKPETWLLSILTEAAVLYAHDKLCKLNIGLEEDRRQAALIQRLAKTLGIQSGFTSAILLILIADNMVRKPQTGKPLTCSQVTLA